MSFPNKYEALASAIKALTRAKDESPSSGPEILAEVLRDKGFDAETVKRAMEVLGLGTIPGVLGTMRGNKRQWFSNADIDLPRWHRHRDYLADPAGAGATEQMILQWDVETNRIMDELPNPRDTDEFDCRGLVVGSVQSGKTANFTALISKAADAGYDLFIVFAGLINDLRKQTQERIQRTLTGSRGELDFSFAKDNWISPPDDIAQQWINLTGMGGDLLEPEIGEIDNTQLCDRRRPKVIVMKKNDVVLARFLDRIHGLSLQFPMWKKRLKVLIIDDEADHASINNPTSAPEDDGTDSKSASTINHHVRTLLNTFPSTSYVGYTATPFANLLTTPWPAEDDELKDTLYPRDFVISLNPSAAYMGPSALFSPHRANGESPRIVNIEMEGEPTSEDEILRAFISPNWHPVFAEVPESLARAVADFLVSGVIRSLRGQGNEHHTMLVHVDYQIENQETVKELVQGLVDHWSDKLRFLASEDSKRVYEFLEERYRTFHDEDTTWEQVRKCLDTNSDDNFLYGLALVASINSDSEDKLEYLDKKEEGLRVIAVGGNRLSRGLTLDGLTVSYFIRSSKNYDTLLQMGRWFGYRTGYDDLVRIHTSERIIDWFCHLADVEAQIREDITRYEHLRPRRTPRALAVRIMTHADMMPTGRYVAEDVKTIGGRTSYGGKSNEERRLPPSAADRKNNWDHASRMFEKIECNTQFLKRSTELYQDVPFEWIYEFLSGYQTSWSEENRTASFSTDKLAKLLKDNREDEATSEIHTWTVGLHSPKDGKNKVTFGGGERGTVNRSSNPYDPRDAHIETLMPTASIQAIDLSGFPKEWEPFERKRMLEARNAENQALLLVYLIDKDSSHPSDGTHLFRDRAFDGISIQVVLPDITEAEDGEYLVVRGIDHE